MTRGSQINEEVNQGAHLGGFDLLTIGGHVAAARRAVADLINELVACQARADAAQVRSPAASDAFQSMAIAALLVLEDDRALQLQWTTRLHHALRDWVGTPSRH